MNFDPCDTSLKIRNSIGIPTPKMGVHLGMCGFIPHTPMNANVTPRLHFRPTPFHAFDSVANLRLKS